jgi:hypothetical protein
LGSLNVTMLPSRMRASHWPHIKANHRAIASRPLNRLQSSAGSSASAGFAHAAPVTAGHRDNHSFGEEVTRWERRAIDPIATSRMLWVSTRRIK